MPTKTTSANLHQQPIPTTCKKSPQRGSYANGISNSIPERIRNAPMNHTSHDGQYHGDRRPKNWKHRVNNHNQLQKLRHSTCNQRSCHEHAGREFKIQYHIPVAAARERGYWPRRAARLDTLSTILKKFFKLRTFYSQKPPF